MSSIGSIPVSTAWSPSAISQSASNMQLITDLQIVSPKYWSFFVEKFGQQNLTFWLSQFGGMEEVKGQTYFWFEDKGKLMLAVTNQTAVTAPAVGATVTVTITSGDHFDSGTLSALRVGETVRIASSGIEGKILTVNKTTPSAHSCTIRPLQSTQAFVSAGSADLLANEVLQLAGDTEAGEGSTAVDPQLPLDVKISNTVTQIRDDWKSTDLGQMEQVYYDDIAGGLPAGSNETGLNAYTYKALIYTNRRFLNNIDLKLIKGNVQTNTGLNAGTQGTQGLIPAVQERGATLNYTTGSLDIFKIHEITRQMRVNGSPAQNMWISDVFQKNEFDDQLFAQYPAGAFVWGTGAASEEASVAYGFRNFLVDGYMFQSKDFGEIFNTEIGYGKSPANDQYRNFGIICPQGSTRDYRSAAQLKNLTVMYQQPPGGGTVGNGIRVWPYGGGSPNPTDGTMTNSVAMITYRMLRVAAANQFVLVQGS